MRHRFLGPVLVAILVGAFVLSSCATTQSPTTSDSSAKDSKPYGSLVIQATFSRGGSLDPLLQGSGTSFMPVGAAIFDSLTELSPDAQVRPGLVERWEIAPDGKTQTFYIRKGVKFHNGDELTGADVKFSIERVLSPKSVHADVAVWRGAIDKVELKDDYTVVVRMKTPQFELLRGFVDMSGSAAVVPKKYIEEKGDAYFANYPVGTGPWKVVGQEFGVRVDLEAFEDHWRAVPKFKNITLIGVLEDAARVAMLKTGELDIADVTPDSVPGLKSAGLRIVGYKGGAQYVVYLFYDLDHPEQYPLGDIRVRKALSLAINRPEMASQIMGGYAEPSGIYLVPTTAYFFDTSLLKPDPYDTEGAKKLLAEAGLPNGFSMKLWNPGVGSESVLNLAVAGYWRKIGVNAEVINRDNAMITSMYNPKHVPEVWNTAVGKIAMAVVTGSEKLTSYHSLKGTMRNLRNLKLDQLIDKIPQTLDPAEKKKVAIEAAVMARNEYAFLAVLDNHTVLALGPKIDSMTTTSNMSSNAYNFVTITHPR